MKKLITLLILLFCASTANAELRENGETSNIFYFTFRDQATGVVDTGVVVGNIDTYYIEEGALISAKTDLAAHAAGDDAWDATPQGYHMGFGEYRIDFPNAAFDGGVGKTVVLIAIDGDDGAFSERILVELSAPVNSVLVGGATPLSAADIEAEAVDALESFELDNLVSVDTGVDVGGDLEAFVSEGSIMAHLMGVAEDVTTYNGATDSLEAQGTIAATLVYLVEDTGQTTDQDLESYVEAGSILAHMMGEAADVTLYKASTDAMSLGNSGSSAAAIADAVLEELTTDHDHIRWSVAWVLDQILNNTGW